MYGIFTIYDDRFARLTDLSLASGDGDLCFLDLHMAQWNTCNNNNTTLANAQSHLSNECFILLVSESSLFEHTTDVSKSDTLNIQS